MNKIDYQERYDALVKTIVMTGDLLICNLLFHWACSQDVFSGQSSELQSHLLLTAVYFGCTIKGGIILHKKKVRNFQIVGIVLRNLFYFSIAATLLLKAGNFLLPAWGLYAVYLFSLFVCISCFRLGVRFLIKFYWRKIRHRNGVVFVGSTENNVTLYHELADDPSIGYWVCGYFDALPNGSFPPECPYLGTPQDVIPYLEKHKADVRNLYCCLPSNKKMRYCPLSNIARIMWSGFSASPMSATTSIIKCILP